MKKSPRFIDENNMRKPKGTIPKKNNENERNTEVKEKQNQYNLILGLSPKQLEFLIENSFPNEAWATSFLNSEHHGPEHGHTVAARSVLLKKHLNMDEQLQFNKEAQELDSQAPLEAASTVLRLASFLHDCGRYADDGSIHKKRTLHPKRSAERAKRFCEMHNLEHLIPALSETILYHDFQSQEVTPFYGPAPTTILGKIIQAADQLDWVHPDAIKRPILFHDELSRKKRMSFFKTIIPLFNQNPRKIQAILDITKGENYGINLDELTLALEDPNSSPNEIYDIFFDPKNLREFPFQTMFNNNPDISLHNRYHFPNGIPIDTFSVYLRLCFGDQGPQRFGTVHAQKLESIWRQQSETKIRAMIASNQDPINGEAFMNPDYIEQALQVFDEFKTYWLTKIASK